jgi:WD40 repeat protein
MNTSESCPVCGTKFGDTPGFCPACAWKGLLEVEDAEEPLPLSDRVPEPPQTLLMKLAGHEVLEEIARGGMGIVYRARQLNPERTVALKMLLPQLVASPDMAERFRLEVRTLTELEHPAILPVHQTGEHDGLPFFTMKLATGGTLAQRKESFSGDWWRIAELVATLADAVQFAHERGVLHRDLKPGNILFDEQDRAYVSDFGLAKVADVEADLTRSLDFLGTPHYVAPEIATKSARQATTVSDVYSLGAVLYELLCGRPPFEAKSVPALLTKIVDEEPIIRLKDETVPRDLEVICLKCLEKEPGRRYGSAGALADDLRRWFNGQPIRARPVTRAERTWKWVRRNPVLATLAVALLLSLVGGGVGLWQSGREVRSALKTTQKAENQARQNLREALLAQSRALGAAHASGQRWTALEALSRAAQIRPSLELRNEVAAALARPDLREVRRFTANIGGTGSSVVFTSDLEGYFIPEASGGFAFHRTKDQRVIARYPDISQKPARWFVLSPDDREVAAVMDDYRIEIWPVGATQPRLQLQGTYRAPAVAAFHPDGVTVAGYVPGDGAFLQKRDEREVLQSTNGRVIFMRFDPAGQRLAVIRESGGVELWRCAGTPSLAWFQPMKRTVPWLSWSPDGGRMAAAADDGRGLRIFSADDGQTELVYSQHLLYPRQFEFDPTGRMIASMGQDWALRLWDARTGQDLVTGVGRHRVMRFSTDGRRLSTAPTDGELAILELAPEQVFREFHSTGPDGVISARLARSADGRLLAVGHPQPHVFDTVRGREIGVINIPLGAMLQVLFENNASAIFYSIGGQGIYRREFSYDSNASPDPVFQWREERLISVHTNTIVWSAVKGGQTWVCHGEDRVELWPERDARQSQRMAIRSPLERLAASENGRWLATPERAAQKVSIWDCETGHAVTNLAARGVDGVWFSPDSRWIIASVAGGYRTWETGTWKASASWEARLDSGNPGEITFSADSRLLVARQEREVFRVLSFPDCQELVTLKPPLVLPVRSACLSPDGRRLWLLAPPYRVFEWNLGELQSELAKLNLAWE